jgi:hypothetical protein
MADENAPENLKQENLNQSETSNEVKSEGDLIEESPIEEMRRLTKEMKDSKVIIEAEIKKLEKIKAESFINGHSRQSAPKVIESVEDKWRREAKVRYEGTGMDPT